MLHTTVLTTALLAGAAALGAQGVTTGAISGTVTNDQGQGVDGVQVQVVNNTNGSRASTVSRTDGHFYVSSLEIGGPYTVSIRHIGFAPKESGGIMLALGQNYRVDFRLSSQAVQLAAVTVSANAEASSALISASHKGVATTVTDSEIARLPTLNRNFTDFVTLTPQISTKGPGNSGGGQNNRFNAIQIDGAIASDLFGLGATGQPGAQANAKQISLEAVKEYQVLLSPFDVRQGYFSGFLVNAVTKSGSNDFHGSGTYAFRDEKLERDVSYLRAAPFSQKQEGFWMGGPIVKDKIFFSVAPEFQQQQQPAGGPYIGAGSATVAPATQAAVDSFVNILKTKYNFADPGNAQKVSNQNPLANMFTRLDFVNLPGNSRLMTRWNYVKAQEDVFSRSATRVNLSNNGYNFQSTTNSGLAQLFTNFDNGTSNEAIIGFTAVRDDRIIPINAPFVVIQRVTNPNGGTGQLSAGTENSSQGNQLDQDIFELTDNYTIPWHSHRITLGTKNEFYRVRNLFGQNSFGNFTFGNLDSLLNDTPNSATLGLKLDNSDGAARFRARTLGAYISDEWQASSNLAVTMGLRLDVPDLLTSPGNNPVVTEANLGRNTTQVPTNVQQWQPRVGFNWDVTGDQVNQVRGGSGFFMAEPAYVWLSNLYGNSGVNGFGNVTCNGFTAAPAMQAAGGTLAPNCLNSTAAPAVTLNTVQPDLHFPEAWRSTIGYDRKLPGGVVGTFEAMYTRSVYQFFYQNLGIVANPIGVDANGRSLYGNITSATSAVVPTRRTYVNAGGATASLGDVIDLQNTGTHDYSYSYTGQLEKRFSDAFEGSFAYTYSHSYDVWDVTSSVALSNWQFGRSYSGPQDSQALGLSKFDAPHRFVVAGTYSFPTKTDLSMTFFAESGVPFEYVYGSDMNGDNGGSNDLMYVPKNARDTTQIRFAQNGNLTPAMQADSLENFISSHSCLNSQRGTIMQRNSCRTPWTKFMNVSARQSLPTLHGHNFMLQLDVFNFLNLLNKNWGAQDLGSSNSPALLTRRTWVQPNVGQPLSLLAGAMPVFNYNSVSQFNTNNASSNYALQLQLKYTF